MLTSFYESPSSSSSSDDDDAMIAAAVVAAAPSLVQSVLLSNESAGEVTNNHVASTDDRSGTNDGVSNVLYGTGGSVDGAGGAMFMDTTSSSMIGHHGHDDGTATTGHRGDELILSHHSDHSYLHPTHYHPQQQLQLQQQQQQHEEDGMDERGDSTMSSTIRIMSGEEHMTFYLSNRSGELHDSCPNSWRTRDTIYALLSSRQRHILSSCPNYSAAHPSPAPQLQLQSSYSKKELKSKQKQLKLQQQQQQPPPILINSKANQFPIAAALATLTNNNTNNNNNNNNNTKQQMAMRAMDAAALSVLRAVRNQMRNRARDQQHAAALMEEENDHSNNGGQRRRGGGSGNGGDGELCLPPLLQVIDSIRSVRDSCFADAASSTCTTSTTTGTGSGGKKRVKKETNDSTTATNGGEGTNKRKKQSPSSSSRSNTTNGSPTATTTTTTTTGSSNNNTSNSNNKRSSSTLLTNNHNTAQSSSTTTTTSTSSATHAGGTNIDSRATVSRAILCAAASYTFQNLTPKFDDDGTVGDVHVCDVPQNTHGSGGGGDSKPIINMGAVMMSAEIFAKRSMEQARGAALRGDKRRRWRMGCAKRDLEVWDVECGTGLMRTKKDGNTNADHDTTAITTTTTTSNDEDMDTDETHGSGGWVEAVLRNSLRNCTNAFALDGRNAGGTVTESSDSDDHDDDTDEEDDHDDNEMMGGYCASRNDALAYFRPKTYSEEWTQRCMPRLMDILYSGPGHAMLCDLQWQSRADRVVQVLHQMAEPNGGRQRPFDAHLSSSNMDNTTTQSSPLGKKAAADTIMGETNTPHQHEPNYGPHLIITTASDMQSFADLFGSVDYSFMGTTARGDTNRNRTNSVVSAAYSNIDNSDSDDGASFYNHGNKQQPRLRALQYTGTNTRRRRIRMKHFTSNSLSGLPDCPYNVIITTYESFFKDYIHFCQIPFQAVVLDDGMSWLGTAHYDPNGQLGKIFEMGVWSKSDNHAGLAGVGYDTWDFSMDVKPDGSLFDPTLQRRRGHSMDVDVSVDVDVDADVEVEDVPGRQQQFHGKNTNSKSNSTANGNSKAGLIGLSARHKIIIASSLHAKYRDAIYPTPVPGLLSFLIPQFADVVREEWDRSRIHTCKESMNHVRKLLCRGVCVYTGSDHARDMYSIVMSSMHGTLDLRQFPLTINRRSHGHSGNDSGSNSSDTESDLDDCQTLSAFKKSRGGGGNTHPHTNNTEPIIPVPREIGTDEMVSDGKIVQSRRFAASWLRTNSPIRYEIGSASLDYIVNAMKARAASGHVCEEVVAASSITSSGAGGMVTGPAGYRTAVRCGRTFGSEQGLRQHIAALHAPPGTWLCRSCASDCGTSQARTHHERSCGTNAAGAPGGVKENSSGGGIPTVGQGIGSATATKQVTGIVGQGPEDKDKDGCFRVPSYRGVWVNPMGKHFVKINGVPLIEEVDADKVEDTKESGTITLFNNADEAARMHDDAMKQKGDTKNVEMNFKPDGIRIIYEDAAANAAAGRGLEMLGGGASSVVPALSVINIKDLPKGVVPLLRDPKQTSRTGGNSKRYIYAYRGVCRQARKGHDRWQSQISFGGTNHYLGTFDSEWDAAAIYAWAHLILYGEEETKKAQKQGEEAVAAYEQEKKDIADGKIIAPPPKAAKKKKAVSTKEKPAASRAKADKKDKKGSDRSSNSKKATQAKEFMKPIVPKMASKDLHGDKVPSDDNALMNAASERIFAIRKKMGKNYTPRIGNSLCIPVEDCNSGLPVGCAMLVGLSSSDCDWDMDALVQSTQLYLEEVPESFVPALRSEYNSDGMNFRFRTVMQGTSCLIGKASKKLEQASTAFGLLGADLGGTIADIDCNIGGIDGSCSEIAACISYSSSTCSFEFAACNDDDIVTLNGEQVKFSMGSFPLETEAICGVGSRVFMFVLPLSTS